MGKEQFEARNPNPAGTVIGGKRGKQARMSYIAANGKRQWHTGSIASLLGKGPKVKSLIGEKSAEK